MVRMAHSHPVHWIILLFIRRGILAYISPMTHEGTKYISTKCNYDELMMSDTIGR